MVNGFIWVEFAYIHVYGSLYTIHGILFIYLSVFL